MLVRNASKTPTLDEKRFRHEELPFHLIFVTCRHMLGIINIQDAFLAINFSCDIFFICWSSWSDEGEKFSYRIVKFLEVFCYCLAIEQIV